MILINSILIRKIDSELKESQSINIQATMCMLMKKNVKKVGF